MYKIYKNEMIYPDVNDDNFQLRYNITFTGFASNFCAPQCTNYQICNLFNDYTCQCLSNYLGAYCDRSYTPMVLNNQYMISVSYRSWSYLGYVLLNTDTSYQIQTFTNVQNSWISFLIYYSDRQDFLYPNFYNNFFNISIVEKEYSFYLTQEQIQRIVQTGGTSAIKLYIGVYNDNQQST